MTPGRKVGQYTKMFKTKSEKNLGIVCFETGIANGVLEFINILLEKLKLSDTNIQ